MRCLAMALLILATLTVTFAGSDGADPSVQAEPAPHAGLFRLDDVPTDTTEAKVWLPEISKSWPVPVRAGTWRDAQDVADAEVTFTVTADRRLCNFRNQVFSCGAGPFVFEGCTGIAANGSVSFSARGMGLSGRFESPTRIRGTWMFITPRCVEQGRWAASFME